MKFRKKPVVIDAFKWTGGPDQEEDPEWIVDAIKCGDVVLYPVGDTCRMEIKTLEGFMTARPGDYIIRGVKGEIYPCKPDIFAATYEPAESEPAGAGRAGESVLRLKLIQSLDEYMRDLYPGSHVRGKAAALVDDVVMPALRGGAEGG